VTNIVIANMQANLTLNSQQFHDAADKAEARLEQIEQRAKQAAGEGRSLVGLDMADGSEERQQRRRVERSQEQREELDMTQRTVTAATGVAVAEEAAYRRRTDAARNHHRTLREMLTETAAQAEITAQKLTQAGGTGGWTGGVPSGVVATGAVASPVLPSALTPEERRRALMDRVFGPGGTRHRQTHPEDIDVAAQATQLAAEQADRTRRTQTQAAKDAAQRVAPPTRVYTEEELRRMPIPEMLYYRTAQTPGWGAIGAGGFGNTGWVDPELELEQRLQAQTADRIAAMKNQAAAPRIAPPTTNLAGAVAATTVLSAIRPPLKADPARDLTIQRSITGQGPDADLVAQAQATMQPGETLLDAIQRVAQGGGGPADPLDLDADPSAPRRGPFRGTGLAVSYQRYIAANTPIGAAVTGFAGQLSPQLAQMVPVVTSAAVAVAALGVALGQAASHGLELSKSMFQVESVLKANVEGFSGSTEFIKEQAAQMRELGFRNQETRSSFIELVTWTQDEAKALELMGMAADLARAKGRDLTEVSAAFSQVIQGQPGVLRQYGINVSEAATATEAFRKVQDATRGEAARFATTAAGDAAKLKAEWEDALEVAGERMLPTIQILTQGLTALVPLLGGALGIVGEIANMVIKPLGEVLGTESGELERTTQKVRDLLAAEIDLREERERAEGFRQYPGFSPTQNVLAFLRGGATESEVEKELARQEFMRQRRERFVAQGGGIDLTGGIPEFEQFWSRSQQMVQVGNQVEDARKAMGMFAPGQLGGLIDATGPSFFANQGPAISAIKAIADEMDLTRTAVRGVQDAFKEMALFDVDYKAVEGTMGEFADAVRFMQELFADIARDMDLNEYRKTQTYLQTAQQVAGTITGSAQAFTAMFDTQGLLPTESEVRGFQERIVAMMTFFQPIAEEAMPGGLGPEGGPSLEIAKLNAWSESMGALMDATVRGADALQKVHDLRPPNTAQMRRFVDSTREFMQMLNDMLLDLSTGRPEIGPPGPAGGGMAFGTVGTYSEHAAKLMQFAAGAAQVLGQFRSMRMPSENDVREFAARTRTLTTMMADMAHAAMGEAQGRPGDMDMLTGKPAGGQDDPRLAAAARWADNAVKLTNLASSAANTFENMRRLRIPNDQQIRTLAEQTRDLVMAMASMVPQDAEFDMPVDIVDEGKWAEDGNKLVALAATATAVFENMRRLRMPSDDALREVARRSVLLVNAMASYVPKEGVDMRPVDLLDEGEWAADGAKLVSVAAAATNVFESMRRLRMPSQDAIDEVARRTAGLVRSIARFAPADGDVLAEAGLWADDAAKLVSLAQGTAELLKSLRRFREPSEDDVRDFITGMVNITSMLASVGKQGMSDAALMAIQDWTDGIGPLVSVAQSTAALLQELRRLRVPSEESVAEFVAMTDTIASMLVGISGGMSERVSMAAEDWALAVGPIVDVAIQSAQLLAQLREYRQPTQQHVDNFIATTEYVAEGFAKMALRWSLDIAEHAADIAEYQGQMFATMQAAATVFDQLDTLGRIPERMITDFFDNMDEAVDQFNARSASWDQEMDKGVLRVSEEVDAQMAALSQGADFFLKLGKLKPDYSNAIRGFFQQLRLATSEFARAVPEWKAQMDDDTKLVSEAIEGQGNALMAAMNPLLAVEEVSNIYPDQISRAFKNVREAIKAFSDLRNSPELQGDSLADMKLFSAQMAEIFGGMQTTIDAALAINEPTTENNSMYFANVMNDFFLEAVPRYGQVWAETMTGMGLAAQGMAGTVIGAVGSIPMHDVGTVRNYGAAGGGNVYNVSINGVDVASDRNLEAFLARWTSDEVIRQGGVPVGKSVPRQSR
jgi:hypothetical protein